MRAAIYCRVSTLDQNPQSQLLDLQQLAAQRAFEVIKVYTDHGVSGTRTRRPALDDMLADARRGRFEVLLIWSCDRIAEVNAASAGSFRRAQPSANPVCFFP